MYNYFKQRLKSIHIRYFGLAPAMKLQKDRMSYKVVNISVNDYIDILLKRVADYCNTVDCELNQQQWDIND